MGNKMCVGFMTTFIGTNLHSPVYYRLLPFLSLEFGGRSMSECFEQHNYTFILRPKQNLFLGAADSRQCRKMIGTGTYVGDEDNSEMDNKQC